MKQRMITGVLGGAVFLTLLWVGRWGYAGMVTIMATIGFLEFCRMKRVSFQSVQSWIGLMLVWSLLLAGLTEQGMLTIGLLKETDSILTGLLLFLVLTVISRNRIHVDEIAYLFLGALYIGYGFSYMIQARLVQDGLAWSLLVVTVTFANDTAAYFLGKRWGKRKLWPSVSPNKTWEGSLGGVGFSLIVSFVHAILFPALGDMFVVLGIGFLVSVMGQFGDLIESAVKRSMGVKDSGTLLPGHGGVLDRFDSLLFVFPVLHLVQLI
ncbi:phosphatidate cytidylyltransferase [Melghirimyces algeriensis]|uniref:Phosphatidate cytidylyltransferase n=1 Tax=Melghirimyces algeriensis TaxID=910412 RepID=A0A521C2N6_9BACL|nr:phosphatidate cytidylyltransferase [Melghirimyces algeriensis]SMO53653.1 phosphatidate cytidylyltransferase [Melghirimyces algeriensis]